MPVLFDRTYGMPFPPSPTQFALPSLALIPAVIPKGGMSEVSTEPEEAEERHHARRDHRHDADRVVEQLADVEGLHQVEHTRERDRSQSRRQMRSMVED